MTAVQLGVNEPALVTNPFGGLNQMKEVGPKASTHPINVLAMSAAMARKILAGFMRESRNGARPQGLTGTLYKNEVFRKACLVVGQTADGNVHQKIKPERLRWQDPYSQTDA